LLEVSIATVGNNRFNELGNNPQPPVNPISFRDPSVSLNNGRLHPLFTDGEPTLKLKSAL